MDEISRNIYCNTMVIYMLHIYDHSMVIHVKFHEGVISYIGELLSLYCLHFFKDF